MSSDAAVADIHLCLFAYGGVEPETMDSVLAELFEAQRRGVLMSYSRTGDDALISRSRSFAASRFLDSGSPVMVMVDHDIAWEPGDLLALAQKAKEENTLVAGMYPCRAFQQGFASRLVTDGVPFAPGGNATHEAEYVATGFLAIPRGVLVKMAEQLQNYDHVLEDTEQEEAEALRIFKCIGLNGAESEPFYDFFRCFSTRGTWKPGTAAAEYEYLSEDWAFSKRAVAVGFTPKIYERPRLRHFGRHGFTLKDAIR